MQQAKTTSLEKNVEIFWSKYLDILSQRGIKESARHWYVKRAEAFIRAAKGKKLLDHAPADINRYLEEQGRKDGIPDWQFLQIIDAIQILLQTANAACGSQVNWEYWRNSAQGLTDTHPTIAREGGILPSDQPSGRAPLLNAVCVRHGKFLDELVAVIRQRNYSIRTEQAYLGWVCRFLQFIGEREVAAVGEAEIASFLQDLAVRGQVAASTQNQALNALVFFFTQVVKREIGILGDFVRAKRPRRLPVVLSRAEASRLLQELQKLSSLHYLMAALLYGTGMRLMECVRLRVQDVDFDQNLIMVRDGKGQKDRVVPFPQSLRQPLTGHLEEIRRLHQEDMAQGLGEVFLPDALARKYTNAVREWIWQFVFPSGRLSVDPRSGATRRHHIHENGLQKSIKKAAQAASISKRVNCHALRHSFATHLLESGHDIRTIQELLGHADVSTTMIYTHVLNRGGHGVLSPLDSL
ncbi:MAG: integron integrase [Proteobacteria bacterium]|nr:integron integrase [Pseudomonadota bacterium]MBU4294959.1 integron integrase [Pseudomonadota bacterium]